MYKIKIYSLKKVKKRDKYFNQLTFVPVEWFRSGNPFEKIRQTYQFEGCRLYSKPHSI